MKFLPGELERGKLYKLENGARLFVETGEVGPAGRGRYKLRDIPDGSVVMFIEGVANDDYFVKVLFINTVGYVRFFDIIEKVL
jgi:hypothetical protein